MKKITHLLVIILTLSSTASALAGSWESSPYNWNNSSSNWKNSEYNWDNSPSNWNNSTFNTGRSNGVFDTYGNQTGYTSNGNIFNNSGSRTGYYLDW